MSVSLRDAFLRVCNLIVLVFFEILNLFIGNFVIYFRFSQVIIFRKLSLIIVELLHITFMIAVHLLALDSEFLVFSRLLIRLVVHLGEEVTLFFHAQQLILVEDALTRCIVRAHLIIVWHVDRLV